MNKEIRFDAEHKCQARQNAPGSIFITMPIFCYPFFLIERHNGYS
jgi:hypothetical protein